MSIIYVTLMKNCMVIIITELEFVDENELNRWRIISILHIADVCCCCCCYYNKSHFTFLLSFVLLEAKTAEPEFRFHQNLCYPAHK